MVMSICPRIVTMIVVVSMVGMVQIACRTLMSVIQVGKIQSEGHRDIQHV